ncbi:hypothetical protein ACVA51_10680 [Pseudomonas luteola]
MKGITLALLAAVSSSTALAATPSSEMLDTCKKISEMAGTVMKARQEGVSMSRMMDITAEKKSLNDVTTLMITQAYDRTRMNSEDGKLKAINDYKDQYYGLCLKRLNK